MEVAADAKLTATDRFPSPEAMVTLREAAAKHGTRLLLSLGGNARTNGFPQVRFKHLQYLHTFNNNVPRHVARLVILSNASIVYTYTSQGGLVIRGRI